MGQQVELPTNANGHDPSGAVASLSLAGIRLLKPLPAEERAELEKRCAYRRFATGQTVLENDRIGIGVFFMISGAARVVHYVADHQEITIAAVVPGDTLGEISAIDSLGRAATVIADEPCVIAELPKEDFHALIVRNGAVALALLQRWAGIIRALDEKISYLSTGSPDQRVYSELIRLARQERPEGGRWMIRELPSHHELAVWAQTSREVVASAIAELVRRGLAERRTRTLFINDYRALKDLIASVGGKSPSAPAAAAEPAQRAV
ncbi:MAG TPA: Crp/Fnr family transcriptional regulator [Candidatus Cybelea sp.]|nr:Crp/Fnr family transcriptional regulator [Candidatus Cybelea sp.]